MKKYIVIVTVILLVLVSLFFIYKNYNEKKYSENISNALNSATQIAIISETVTSLYSTVWRDAIYEEGAYNDYKSPYYRLRFNSALSLARKDENIKKALDEIDSNLSKLVPVMGELKNPPSRFTETYSDVVELYTASVEYSNLAKDPSGSLLTFSQKRNDLSSKISNLITKIKVKE
jgi:hypothetical protein